MYPWIVFLHVLGGFIFMMAHGVSAFVSFKLRGEKELSRIQALLELSSYSLSVMYGGLLLLFVAGIVAGIMGNWWGRLWIWTALGLLIALAVAMYYLGSAYYSQVRKAAGLAYFVGSKEQPPVEPNLEEALRVLSSSRPVLLATIGLGGLGVILWLMLFKPF